MKHQAAYSLLYLSGNAAPSKLSDLKILTYIFKLLAQQQVEDFMKASGVSVDAESLKIFFQTIEGKAVPELVQAGSKKTISMPRGGGGGGAAAAGGAAAVEAPVEEEKKEEVEDVDMGGLFGDDDDDY